MNNLFSNEPRERIASVLPARVAGLFLLLIIIGTSLLLLPTSEQTLRKLLAGYGIGSSLYIFTYHLLQFHKASRSRTLAFANSILVGICMGVLLYLVPSGVRPAVHGLTVIFSISTVIMNGRGPTYLFILLVTTLHAGNILLLEMPITQWVFLTNAAILAVIATEAIQQSKNISRHQVSRLEAINKVGRQMISTLDTKELIKLLDVELKKVLSADTYFIGVQKNSNLHMELFYDDGAYYNGMELDMEGTLSKWVIQNEQPLFLPNLREAEKLEGVIVSTAGKDKTSLSWMGVPMKGSHVNGLMAIASYTAHAFTRSDLELLSNIAQLVVLALDNSYHHAQVEEQARLDSLTKVYNHGYFIHTLRGQAQACLLQNKPLSLIMLDVDHFKQYNDSHGHLAGDEILVNLCAIIRKHIKQSDVIGRWGGEEFAISLPNLGGEQAHQVAQRIQSSLSELKLNLNSGDNLPTPTVSMGIAIFPAETSDVSKLIDLADKRLYIAKKRGRDQIEAAP
jgi:diguanylate cyclase (GGDEF)-like protein